jgi:hypothetical protein
MLEQDNEARGALTKLVGLAQREFDLEGPLAGTGCCGAA